MSQTKIVYTLIISSFFALGVGYIFSEPLKFGICKSTYSITEGGPATGCLESFGENIPEPLLWSFLPLLIISFILFFVRREVFIAWAKFAGVAFPIILGILLYTFNNTPALGSWIGGPTDDQLASVLLPTSFLIISLLIIIIKSWRLRGK